MLRPRRKEKLRRRSALGGFVLIELLVVAFIVALVSGSATVSYKNSQDQYAVSTTAQRLMADLRRAQNMALAGKTQGANAPQGYGLYVSSGSQYVLFYNNNGNTLYAGSTIFETITLNNATLSPVGTSVYFSPPGPTTYINGFTGGSQIFTIISGNYSKKVMVDASGGRIEIGDSPDCTSVTYDATWGPCQPNNQQTRGIVSKSPPGCTIRNPNTTQSCTYVPPVCTSWTYTGWVPDPCSIGQTQTRTIISSSPAGCSGGSPEILSQSCGATPVCTSWTYSPWTPDPCVPGATQTRTIISSGPAGCTGGSPILSQTCSTQTCTSWTYSSWTPDPCVFGTTQTRTILSVSPPGCSGGNPVLSQSCQTDPTCTSWTYSGWGACQAGTGSGTVTASVGTLNWSGDTGTAAYDQGTSVTLTAVPDSGSVFSGWSGCDSANGNICAVIMDAAKSVTAIFNLINP
jgi:Tfp pilus assembly protein FimT